MPLSAFDLGWSLESEPRDAREMYGETTSVFPLRLSASLPSSRLHRQVISLLRFSERVADLRAHGVKLLFWNG